MQKYSVTDFLAMGNGKVAIKTAKVEMNNGYVTNILKRDKGRILEMDDASYKEFSKLRGDKTKAKVYLSKVVNKVLKAK